MIDDKFETYFGQPLSSMIDQYVNANPKYLDGLKTRNGVKTPTLEKWEEGRGSIEEMAMMMGKSPAYLIIETLMFSDAQRQMRGH